MSYDSEVAADSPLGYWKLDETSGTVVADSSGNGRDLTNNTAVVNQATVMPTGVKSYDFRASVTDTLSRVPESWMLPSSFTVEGWIRPDATSSYRAIISKDGTSAGRSWSLYVHGGKLDVNNGATDSDGATTLSIGSVYHVAATYDSATTTLKLYVNGVLDGTFTKTINQVANTLRVGVSQAGTGSLNFPFDGRIDNLAFYGTALSAARILAHYNAGLSNADTGAIAATLPALTGSAAGTVTEQGAIAATLPALTSASAGQVVETGSIAAVLPALTASISENPQTSGVIAATLPGLTGSAAGGVTDQGAVVANLPALTASITVDNVDEGTVHGSTQPRWGRDRDAAGYLTVDVPVDPDPPTLRHRPLRITASSLPAPNFVDGRPA